MCPYERFRLHVMLTVGYGPSHVRRKIKVVEHRKMTPKEFLRHLKWLFRTTNPAPADTVMTKCRLAIVLQKSYRTVHVYNTELDNILLKRGLPDEQTC